MPIHLYKCSACELSKKYLIQGTPSDTRPCPSCESAMSRQVGTPDGIFMETSDEYRGKSRFQDTERKRQERASDYMSGIRVKKAIERDGTAEAKIRGWVDEKKIPK